MLSTVSKRNGAFSCQTQYLQQFLPPSHNSRDLAPIETAIDGNPIKRPSIAAATVPEYKTSSPMFGLSLIPETTKSTSSAMGRLCLSEHSLLVCHSPSKSHYPACEYEVVVQR